MMKRMGLGSGDSVVLHFSTKITVEIVLPILICYKNYIGPI